MVYHLLKHFIFPAAHGVHEHKPRKVSTVDYTKHMKSMEDQNSIVFNDSAASASVTEKARKFAKMLSVEQSFED